MGVGIERLSAETLDLVFGWLDERGLLAARLVCRRWHAGITDLLRARVVTGRGPLPRPGPDGPGLTMLDVARPTLLLACAASAQWPIAPCVARLEHVTDSQFLFLGPRARASVVSIAATMWGLGADDLAEAPHLREMRFELPAAPEARTTSEAHYRAAVQATAACLAEWTVPLPHVTRLHVAVPCDAPCAFLACFPGLTALTLEQDPPHDLRARCPALAELALETEGALTMPSFAGLQKLTLRRVDGCEPRAFLDCTALRHLELEAVMFTPGLLFECPNVTSLVLRLLKVRAGFLAQFPRVERLTLQSVLDFGVPAAAAIQNLTSFTAQDMGYRDLAWLQPCAARLRILQLHELPHLRRLELRGLRRLTELSLVKLAKLAHVPVATDLRALRTAHLILLPLRDLCFLRPAWRTLDTLALSRLRNVDTLSPLSFFAALDTATVDDVRRLRCVTPLSTCPRLRVLSLSRCHALENVVLDGAVPRRSRLALLRVHGAHKLEADQVVLPAGLRALSLDELPQFVHLGALVRCARLRDLYVGNLQALVRTEELSELTHLRRLQWQCARTLRFTDVGSLALQALALKTCDFQHADAPFLLRVRHLTWTFTSVHCGFLANSTHLVSLTFENAEHNLDERLPQWVDLTGLRMCASLRCLRVSCYDVRHLEAIADHSALADVVFDRVPSLEGLWPLRTLCALQRAHVHGCPRVIPHEIASVMAFIGLDADARRRQARAEHEAYLVAQAHESALHVVALRLAAGAGLLGDYHDDDDRPGTPFAHLAPALEPITMDTH